MKIIYFFILSFCVSGAEIGKEHSTEFRRRSAQFGAEFQHAVFFGQNVATVTPGVCTPYTGMAHCRLLTIDHNQILSTLLNFPVLVKATLGSSRILQASGYDVAFTSDSGGTTLIPWEQETFTAATGAIVDWVLCASCSSSVDTVIYVSYGNASQTQLNTGSLSPSHVWDANYKGVWHLPDGTTLSVADSTGLTTAFSNTATATAGQVDGAAACSLASFQGVNVGSAINLTTALTLEVWTSVATLANGHFGSMITNIDGSSHGYYFGLLANDFSPANTFYFQLQNGSSPYVFANSPASTSTYYHVVGTYDNATMRLYLNGVAQTSTQSGSGFAGSSTNNVGLCQIPGGDASQGWNGSLDEVRISNIARSADWITAEYNNQKTGSTFVTVGSEI